MHLDRISQLPLHSDDTNYSHATALSSTTRLEKLPLLPGLLISSRFLLQVYAGVERAAESRVRKQSGGRSWDLDLYLEKNQSVELSGQEWPHCPQVPLTWLTQAAAHRKMDARAFSDFQPSTLTVLHWIMVPVTLTREGRGYRVSGKTRVSFLHLVPQKENTSMRQWISTKTKRHGFSFIAAPLQVTGSGSVRQWSRGHWWFWQEIFTWHHNS